MKKRILAFLLTCVMTLSIAPVSLATPLPANESNENDEDDNQVVISKTVTETENKNEYLLTLDAFVTGEASTIEKTKPADIVLVLDQSASMYAPMGARNGKNNKSLYNAEESDDTNVKEITEADFWELSNTDSEFLSNASQLGYYVAQSQAGSFQYCEDKDNEGHKHNSGSVADGGCRTYDWFIIKYVEGSGWNLYRVPQTANPSTDSKVIIDGDISHNESIWHRESLVCSAVEDLANHKGCEKCVLGGSSFKFYKSQYGALYDAISTFADGITEADADHRLAVVGFSSEIDTGLCREGSGVYINGEYIQYNTNEYKTGDLTKFQTFQNIYEASTLTQQQYKSALMEASTTNKENIMSSINAVKSDYYGTNQDVGLDMANKIFAQNPIQDGGRDRIVILFTDGYPSPAGLAAYKTGYNKKEEGMIDAFIEQSNIAKNQYNAQIYTIWTSTLSDDSSAFMRYGSSDYPNAKSMSDVGNQIESPKYASGVKTGDQLMEAFGSVLEDVSSTSTVLKEETIVRDIVSPSFTLPTSNIDGWDNMTEEQQMQALANKIKVYVSKYKGEKTFAEPGDDGYTEFTDAKISVSKDSNGLYQIDVTNFDYSANYVTDLDSGGYVGSKLVIQIPITVKSDFLGGDHVVTNGTASGIYDADGTLVESFPVPEVNIDVSTIIPICTSQDIYLSQMASLPEIIHLGEYEQNDLKWKVDSINNAYVDIVYTITELDSDGQETSNLITYTIPAGTDYTSLTEQGWSANAITAPLLKEDTTYKVSCTVTSATNAENTSVGVDETTVNVYKPEIYFHDSAIELGNTADYETENVGTITWKHGATVADATAMGEAPTLEYIYDPVEGAFKEDTSVKVSVKAKTNGTSIPCDQDITKYVTFYRDACTYKDCEHKSANKVDASDAKRINFVVHIKSFDLTITKNVVSNLVDENQSFIFRVTGPDDFSMDVTIVGSGSTTLTDLPVGTYTIEELKDWSWRYEPTVDTLEVTAKDVKDGQAKVSFTNTRKENKWLSGDCYAENWWGKFTNNN